MTSTTEPGTAESTSTTASTSTTSGARDHARAQAGAITDAMPVVPATDWPHPPADVPAGRTGRSGCPGR